MVQLDRNWQREDTYSRFASMVAKGALVYAAPNTAKAMREALQARNISAQVFESEVLEERVLVAIFPDAQ